MTWDEFKTWVEDKGVKGDEELAFIDFSFEPEHVDRGAGGVMIL